MGWRVDGLGIHDLKLLRDRHIQHVSHIDGVLLAILIHCQNPITHRTRHSGKRCGMLAIIARQPDGFDKYVLLRQVFDHQIGAVRSAIVNQHYLVNDVLQAIRSQAGILRKGGQLCNQSRQTLFAPIHGDHDRDRDRHTRSGRTVFNHISS